MRTRAAYPCSVQGVYSSRHAVLPALLNTTDPCWGGGMAVASMEGWHADGCVCWQLCWLRAQPELPISHPLCLLQCQLL